MKFTKAQMQFIKSKFPDLDEILFAKEALDFVPKKKMIKEVPDEERCTATKKDGERCTKRRVPGNEKACCAIHLKVPQPTPKKDKMEKIQCCATTKKGEQCKKKAFANGLCTIHCQTPAPELVEITPEPVLVV
jgi:hypothetical protein